jgi:hypothetical protein
MGRFGLNFGMCRPASARRFDALTARRQLQQRRRRRERRGRRLGPAIGLDDQAAPRRLAPALSGRPLRVIDGDSFAHRSSYALPKTIRGSDGKGPGAILGFTNFLLRTYAEERPRAVVVGWDSLDAPTKRHEMFPPYQSGREFDDALIEQLKVLPKFLAVCGLRKPEPQGLKRMTLLPPRLLPRSMRVALRRLPAAIGILFSSPRKTRRSYTRCGAAKLSALGPKSSGSDMALIRSKCPT